MFGSGLDDGGVALMPVSQTATRFADSTTEDADAAEAADDVVMDNEQAALPSDGHSGGDEDALVVPKRRLVGLVAGLVILGVVVLAVFIAGYVFSVKELSEQSAKREDPGPVARAMAAQPSSGEQAITLAATLQEVDPQCVESQARLGEVATAQWDRLRSAGVRVDQSTVLLAAVDGDVKTDDEVTTCSRSMREWSRALLPRR